VLVTHDMGVVRRACDRVSVMYSGRVVEEGAAGDVLAGPRHPYTQALLRCLPGGATVDDLVAIPGEPPEIGARPAGCVFAPRCGHVRADCVTAVPPLLEVGAGRAAACVLVREAVDA